MFIGIDDTDSRDRYCTTYVGALLIEELGKKYKMDTPKLIRMNPMVKYKTRGNGGVCLRINEDEKKLSEKDIEYIKNTVIKTVEEYADFECENTNPGIVFLSEDSYNSNREILNNYYKKVLYDIVSVEYAEKIIEKVGGEFRKYKKGYGIIGALGSISSVPPYTYELLTYRKKEKWGQKRILDEKSVIEMDEKTFPFTFNNVDGEKPIIAPHTSCPVLYGIRGIKKDILLKAMDIVKCEEIDKYTIYKTNQGTDVHLRFMEIKDVYPDTGVITYGMVVTEPKNLPGGHVVFKLKDTANSEEINCIAYEPTKEFRNLIRELTKGDLIGVYGTVREEPFGINIEKIKVVKLAKKYEKNKKCSCGGTLKSKGTKSGYKCNKCGKKLRYDEIELIEVKRNIREGFYEVPPSARRHLSKPLILYDLY
ncbi:MAG: tRNA(Ile2)-agmatinylcytidine synthase [Methanothermococcus sp.]|uniref:tRNA(Ile)(2)-agmatinylcytidine synthase n=1 Tax=Methanothermococcus TaxID=155862 RepID=UPI00036E8423|nr:MULTISPECIES: tRNA(Ile)(2)-agmatinylcytidine synthase [Methanothermococcus]MDK2790510.1 tRNA(Ile2)-agmatinylcytidine synthase [Methanothermococcus sp.]MDK2987280.1 tRNA(Ile2)-agmatinylcytidine synthase [Methanothermococcus sp.]